MLFSLSAAFDIIVQDSFFLVKDLDLCMFLCFHHFIFTYYSIYLLYLFIYLNTNISFKHILCVCVCVLVFNYFIYSFYNNLFVTYFLFW